MAILIGQAAMTIAAVEALRRRVLPRLRGAAEPALALDVWMPIALALPLLLLTGRIGNSVQTTAGWLTFGAPAVLLCFAVAAGLIASASIAGVVQGSDGHWLTGSHRLALRRSLLAGGAATLFLLLVAVANDITVWVGQCAFAIGAVLLWMNSPDDPQDSIASNGGVDAAGLGLALLASGGQGALAMMLPAEWLPISGGMMLAGGAMSVAAVARIAGPAAALRLGGWFVVFALSFGTGALSVLRLLPHLREAFDAGYAPPLTRVAYGFGGLAGEALLAGLAIGLAAIAGGLPPRMRHLLGTLLLMLATALGAWRLATQPLPPETAAVRPEWSMHRSFQQPEPQPTGVKIVFGYNERYARQPERG